VSAPDAPQFDEARIVQVLDRHDVAYVLVGGLGALLHGASRPTLDFDLCAAWDLTTSAGWWTLSGSSAPSFACAPESNHPRSTPTCSTTVS
jgi:hypothetical protein